MKPFTLKILADNPIRQECGGCTACCTIMGVEELEKPPFKPCNKICTQGCSIYQDRPHACQEYECLWLLGGIVGPYRPSEFGLMFSTTQPGGILGPILVATEVWTGASQEPKPKYFLEKYSRENLVMVRRNPPDYYRLLGPPRYIALMKNTLGGNLAVQEDTWKKGQVEQYLTKIETVNS